MAFIKELYADELICVLSVEDPIDILPTQDLIGFLFIRDSIGPFTNLIGVLAIEIP